MNSEFKRMQTLAGIVTENDLYEEEVLDFSDLKALSGDLKKVIVAAEEEAKEKAKKEAEEQGLEEILGAVATYTLLGLAAPGLIKAVLNIINTLIKKAPKGFNLYKKGADESKLEWLIAMSGKLDDYLDTPFRFMLKPFIKDAAEREKFAKILKVVTLVLASLTLGVSLTSNVTLKTVVNQLAPDGFEQFLKSQTVSDGVTAFKSYVAAKGL